MKKQMKQIRLISTSVEHTEIGLAQAHMRCAWRRSARERASEDAGSAGAGNADAGSVGTVQALSRVPNP